MSKQYPAGIISKTAVTPSGPYEDSSASGVWTLDQQAYWNKQGLWPTAGNPSPDPYFKYVTMLLHGDGTNAAQNNTFLDSSTNNFTITRNGNTTQGTFTPYGSNWSNYFGSANYFSSSSNAAFALGTGDFTVEAWVFPTSAYTTYNYVLGVAVTNGLVFYVTGGNLVVRAYDTGDLLSSATIPALNTWTHVAATRSGTTLRIFVNGVQTASTTNSTNFAQGAVYAGNDSTNAAPWYGYISNLRLVKGTAVYTSNFTPSTTPLTAVSGTSWLVCQSNRFIDNSSNAFTITTSGSPSVQRFSPFSPTTAYSTSVIGGSGYFDGSGDYLTVPQNTAFNFGTGAFTVEAFVYLTAYPSGGKSVIFSLGNGADVSPATYTGWALTVSSTQLTFYRYDGTETEYVASSVIPLNTWSHVVAVRNSSSNLAIYLNGVRVLSTTSSLSYNNVNTNNLNISYWTSGGGTARYITGYISNGRIVAGTAVYDPTSSTLTVPTAPLTAISGTSLLMNYTNAGILDNAMMNDLETVGNAQVSTSVKKYGTGSMYFDGSGDWVSCPASPQWLMAGDWTIECWIYPNSVTGVQVLVETRNRTTNASPCMYLNGTNLVIDTGTASVVSAGTITISTWQHVAATRSGNSWRIFINGTQVGSTTTNTTSYTTAYGCCIGSSYYNEHYNGYIDDLRITKGVARYTANFTAPTKAFADK